jgi:hypothetical protein
MFTESMKAASIKLAIIILGVLAVVIALMTESATL